MAKTVNSTYELSNGVLVPVVGYGTWQAAGKVAEDAIVCAIEAGYRHIDTASMYKNEEAIGRGIKASSVSRQEIFLTTKLWNDVITYDEARQSLEASLARLDFDYVDLLLIHWPASSAFRNNWQERNAVVWRYLEDALEAGKVRAIGVANFHPHHMDALLKTAKIKPMVNQIHFSPSDPQEKVFNHNKKLGILTQGYSPLGKGTFLMEPKLVEIAQKYGKDSAQISLRWSLQKGVNPLPKSTTPSRIKSNLKLFDFELTDHDMEIIDQLIGTGMKAPNPDEVEF